MPFKYFNKCVLKFNVSLPPFQLTTVSDTVCADTGISRTGPVPRTADLKDTGSDYKRAIYIKTESFGSGSGFRGLLEQDPGA